MWQGEVETQFSVQWIPQANTDEGRLFLSGLHNVLSWPWCKRREDSKFLARHLEPYPEKQRPLLTKALNSKHSRTVLAVLDALQVHHPTCTHSKLSARVVQISRSFFWVFNHSLVITKWREYRYSSASFPSLFSGHWWVRNSQTRFKISVRKVICHCFCIPFFL